MSEGVREQPGTSKSIGLDIVRYLNGKYFIRGDTEVYPYFHMGPAIYVFAVQSHPGELPNLDEVIRGNIQPWFDTIRKQFPRLTLKTNGLVLIAARTLAKKEPVPHRQDTITIEERGEVSLIPCIYTIANGKKRTLLEGPEMFGDVL